MIARKRFQDEVEKIRSRMLSIKSQAALIGIRPIVTSEVIQSAALWEPSGSYVEESNDITGLEPHYKVIKSRLMDMASSGTKQRLISIVGKSSGETTLARKIFNDSEIKNHFTCCALIKLSTAFVPQTWLSDISAQVQAGLQVTDQQTPGVEELTNSLKDFLTSKRYLIVLDDVWMTEDWDILRKAFPKTDEGSGIIVTTRVREVALYANPKSPPYELQLSEEDSFVLLKSKIDVPVELEEVGRAIVRRCMTSAPMILTVGTHLSKKRATRELWKLMLDRLKFGYAPGYNSLRNTTDLLPSYLKQCLYYFGLFKEDYEIPARRLIILWVAEGLAQKEETSDASPEVVAEKYLSKLIEWDMIQVVKRKPDGRVKTCRMHDVLRDEWVEKAKEAKFLPAQNRAQASSSSAGDTISRLADHFDSGDDSYSDIHGDDSSNSSFFRSHYKNVCTLLSFDSREGTASGKEIGDLLRRGIKNRCFQGMRVLDLERVFRPQLPESLGELIHSRYLGLRSVWKMQQLRHLYLSESYRKRFVPPRRMSSLTDLQTLWGAFVDEESIVDNSLYRLTKLRKLTLTCRLTLDQQKATAEWILSLKRLEWLRLISIDILVKPSDLCLEPLSGLENLSSVYLLGRLTNPAMVDRLPEELTELTLSSSVLREDPMPKLEKLPNLKILELLGNAFEGKFMVCLPGGFPLLQVLKLWKLKQLEGWVVGKGSLPILRELEIRACTSLQSIPEGLQHLGLLRELTLTDMPEEFTRRARKDQGELGHNCDQQSQTSTNI
ncbi:hypothetical protein BT93_G1147 [Corymbia citriodora subsp. variegata]|nr:hypothetical protein BT93_G1147 [Corymbia citriodora subsp. variegata]